MGTVIDAGHATGRILGAVACGRPLSSRNQATDPLDSHLTDHPASTIYLSVSGMSMMGAGICDGDVIAVDLKREPRRGDIVLAQCGSDEYTVKRWEAPHLIAIDGLSTPIPIELEADVTLLGVVTSVVKRLSRKL